MRRFEIFCRTNDKIIAKDKKMMFPDMKIRTENMAMSAIFAAELFFHEAEAGEEPEVPGKPSFSAPHGRFSAELHPKSKSFENCSYMNAVRIPEKSEKISIGPKSFIVPLPRYKLHKKI